MVEGLRAGDMSAATDRGAAFVATGRGLPIKKPTISNTYA
jgi:hypothetical protein